MLVTIVLAPRAKIESCRNASSIKSGHFRSSRDRLPVAKPLGASHVATDDWQSAVAVPHGLHRRESDDYQTLEFPVDYAFASRRQQQDRQDSCEADSAHKCTPTRGLMLWERFEPWPVDSNCVPMTDGCQSVSAQQLSCALQSPGPVL